MMPGISYLTIIRHVTSQGGIGDFYGSDIIPSFHRTQESNCEL